MNDSFRLGTWILLPCLFLACAPHETWLHQQQESVMPNSSLVWQSISADQPQEPMISKDGDEVVFRLPGFYLGTQSVQGTNYSRIVLPSHMPLNEIGFPELPKVRTNIIISPQTQAYPTIIEENHLDLPLDPPVPARGIILRTIDPNTVPFEPGPFYSSDAQYPESPFFADVPFTLREHKGQPLQFQPFIYFPSQKIIRVYTTIRIRLNLRAENSASISTGNSSPDFLPIYAGNFLNLAEVTSRYAPIKEPGRLLIITADGFYPAVLPLAEWKQQRGLPTEIVKISEIGTTAKQIQTFIQDQYTDPKSLAYVLLVGDYDTIPTLWGKNEGAACDTCYAMVAGNDFYPDLLVSRISVHTIIEAEAQIAKFIRYERNPDTGTLADWYRKAINVASDEGSPPDWQRAEELRATLEKYGFTSVAQIYDYPENASKTDLIQKLNEGAALLNYLGHGGGTFWKTTKFKTDDAYQLTNGSKLPFIIDASCENGAFAQYSTCLAESFLRAGSKNKPAGAIAMYSASTNTSWNPPLIMQSWIVKKLLAKEQCFTVGCLTYGGSMHVLDQFPPPSKKDPYNSEGVMLMEQYNIFGDASLYIRTKLPQAISVIHPDRIPIKGNIKVMVKNLTDGKPLNNTSVTLFNGTIIASGFTNAQGIAQLDYDYLLNPINQRSGSNKAMLTVFGFNLIPYQKELPVGDTSGNSQPMAWVSVDQTVKSGELVTLDGSNSSDPDGDAITYHWQQQEGPAVTLSDPNSAKPQFTAPNLEKDATLVFTLVVNDSKLDSLPATAKVIVRSPTSSLEINKTSDDTPLDIPDNKPAGISSEIEVKQPGIAETIEVEVDITHSYIGDLVVKLIAPDQTAILLHNQQGGSTDDLHKRYSASALVGKSIKGIWQLQISDLSSRNAGTLNYWKLKISTSPTT